MAEGWRAQFDERQRKEIALDEVYARDFAHGTEGHNARLIIAKMAKMLDTYEADGFVLSQLNRPVMRGPGDDGVMRGPSEDAGPLCSEVILDAAGNVIARAKRM